MYTITPLLNAVNNTLHVDNVHHKLKMYIIPFMCTGKEDVGRKCSLFLNTLDIFVTDFVGYFILILYIIFIGHTIYGRFYGKKLFSIYGRFYGRDTVVDFIDKLLFTADLWTLILIVADFMDEIL